MSTKELNFVNECLKGMECKNCSKCVAEKISWNRLEEDFIRDDVDFSDDLRIYYQVKGKRKIFDQQKNGEYLTLSEPEMLHMFSRY